MRREPEMVMRKEWTRRWREWARRGASRGARRPV